MKGIGPAMRSRSRLGTALLALLVLSAAGCGPDQATTPRSAGSGSGPAASGTGRPTAGSAGGAAPCVVGAWRSEGYTVDTPHATATGGGGFTMNIAADGRSLVDFAGMRPVVLTVTVGGSSIDSHLVYSGRVAGRLKLPPVGGSTGPWESAPGVDWGTVRVTVEVHGTKVLDNVPLADLAAGAGGLPGGTDTQPVLGAGTYTCTGDRLTVAQRTGGSAVTWTLHREG
jgi:hypothetical protein